MAVFLLKGVQITIQEIEVGSEFPGDDNFGNELIAKITESIKECVQNQAANHADGDSGQVMEKMYDQRIKWTPNTENVERKTPVRVKKYKYEPLPRKCEKCGADFIPASNRQKVCRSCNPKMQPKKKEAERVLPPDQIAGYSLSGKPLTKDEVAELENVMQEVNHKRNRNPLD